MPPQTPTCTAPSELPFQELWRAQIARWQSRLPRGQSLGAAEDILRGLQGALWLACFGMDLDNQEATRILRRVLYREYEADWQHQALSLGEFLPYLSAASPTPLELPEHAHPLADAYLHGQGSEGSLCRAMEHFGSRRKVRCINTLLLDLITEGEPLVDLKRRAARLLTSAARDGALKAHVQEAGYIRRALRMLQPSTEVALLQEALSDFPSDN